jgi:hypothetical protein
MKPLEVCAAPLRRHVYQMATGRRDTKEWNSAWEHIKEHLSRAAGAGKDKHGVFDPPYRSEDAVAQLIAETASKPSDFAASQLTVNGQRIGAPCLIIRRWFNKQLGIELGDDGDGGPITTLWVIVGADHRLISAFPRHHPNPEVR